MNEFFTKDDFPKNQIDFDERFNVASRSHVMTDGWLGYTKLESLGYGHKQIFQTKTEDKDSVLPGVHLVASLVKRLLLGTFHGRFGKKYLQKYLDEYVFRFNRRNTKSVGKRFYRIVQQAVKTNPMPRKNIMCCNISPLLANSINLSETDNQEILFMINLGIVLIDQETISRKFVTSIK